MTDGRITACSLDRPTRRRTAGAADTRTAEVGPDQRRGHRHPGIAAQQRHGIPTRGHPRPGVRRGSARPATSTPTRPRCCRWRSSPSRARRSATPGMSPTIRASRSRSVSSPRVLLEERGRRPRAADLPGDELARRTEGPTRIHTTDLAQRILNGLAQPGVHRALVDLTNWTLLKWLDDPCPVLRLARQHGRRSRRASRTIVARWPAMTEDFASGAASGVLRMVANDGGWTPVHVTVNRVELEGRRLRRTDRRCGCPPTRNRSTSGRTTRSKPPLGHSAGPARATARAAPIPSRPIAASTSTATTTSSPSTCAIRDRGPHRDGHGDGAAHSGVGAWASRARCRQRREIGRRLSAVSRDHRRTEIHARDGDRQQHRHHRDGDQSGRTPISADPAPQPPRPAPRSRPPAATTIATVTVATTMFAVAAQSAPRPRRERWPAPHGRSVVAPRRQPRRLPGRVDTSDLHRHRGEADTHTTSTATSAAIAEGRLDVAPPDSSPRRWCSARD